MEPFCDRCVMRIGKLHFATKDDEEQIRTTFSKWEERNLWYLTSDSGREGRVSSTFINPDVPPSLRGHAYKHPKAATRVTTAYCWTFLPAHTDPGSMLCGAGVGPVFLVSKENYGMLCCCLVPIIWKREILFDLFRLILYLHYFIRSGHRIAGYLIRYSELSNMRTTPSKSFNIGRPQLQCTIGHRLKEAAWWKS